MHGALHARRVEFDQDHFTADVEGTFEGGTASTLLLKKIHVTYQLRIPTEQRAAAERAVRVHARACPAHESLKDAIEITWSAEIEEY